MNILTLPEVMEAVQSEIDYQDARWNAATTSTEGKHSVAEFTLFIDDYLREAKTQLSRNPEPDASRIALHTLRKIAAMSIQCMMQNGAPDRLGFGKCLSSAEITFAAEENLHTASLYARLRMAIKLLETLPQDFGGLSGNHGAGHNPLLPDVIKGLERNLQKLVEGTS